MRDHDIDLLLLKRRYRVLRDILCVAERVSGFVEAVFIGSVSEAPVPESWSVGRGVDLNGLLV